MSELLILEFEDVGEADYNAVNADLGIDIGDRGRRLAGGIAHPYGGDDRRRLDRDRGLGDRRKTRTNS